MQPFIYMDYTMDPETDEIVVDTVRITDISFVDILEKQYDLETPQRPRFKGTKAEFLAEVEKWVKVDGYSLKKGYDYSDTTCLFILWR